MLRRIDLQPPKVKLLVLACCALHNLIRKGRPPPTASVPLEPRVEQELQQMPDLDALGLRPTEEARQVRDMYSEFFNTVGAVHWQDNAVNN